MNSRLQRAATLAVLAAGHAAGVVGIGLGVTMLVMPLKHAQAVASRVGSVPDLFEMSATSIALHLGLSACVWAFICIMYQLAKLRLAERRVRPAVVRLSTGSVMTETLIIIPVFFALAFGMGQLAVNNIAGILANVAAYEAGRAAWIWKPEAEAGRMTTSDAIAIEKCRIAVAMVMLPIAPGEFLDDVRLPTYAEKARIVALGANIPLMGTLTEFLPDDARAVFEGGVTVASISTNVAVRGNLSYTAALDTSAFWHRTLRKFTHAFHSAECVINDDHSVKMSYFHQATMPVIRNIFGTFQVRNLRPGYYAEYVREFGLRKQVNTVNTAMPSNNWINIPEVDGGFNPSDYE